MRTTRLVLSLILILGGLFSPTVAGAQSPPSDEDLVVVVSAKNPVEKLTIDEIRRLFLRQQTKWDNGWSVSVFERHSESDVLPVFARKILDRSPTEMHDYWLTMGATRGMEPPTICRSAALLGQFLKRVKGGIGYMRAREVTPELKIVFRLGPER